ALEQAEVVAVEVLAGSEPADAGNRRLVVGFPAELANLRHRRIDVVRVEVHPRPAADVVGLIDGATGIPFDQLVVDSGHARVAEAPAEQASVELLRTPGVGCRQFVVDEPSRHRGSPFLAGEAKLYAQR